MDQVGEGEKNINESINVKKSRRGLARANAETRIRVAKAGGSSKHKRGLYYVLNAQDRKRIAIMGGLARALDKKGLSEAGVKGGRTVLTLYGVEYFAINGKGPKKKRRKKKKQKRSVKKNNPR
jgi:hypothetical protein